MRKNLVSLYSDGACKASKFSSRTFFCSCVTLFFDKDNNMSYVLEVLFPSVYSVKEDHRKDKKINLLYFRPSLRCTIKEQ